MKDDFKMDFDNVAQPTQLRRHGAEAGQSRPRGHFRAGGGHETTGPETAQEHDRAAHI